MSRILSFVLSGALLAAPRFVVFAQSGSLVTQPTGLISSASVFDMACSVLSWVFAFVMLLAVIALLFSAAAFLFSGGEPDRVASARRYLLFSLVGVVVAVLARSLVVATGDFLGADISAAIPC